MVGADSNIQRRAKTRERMRRYRMRIAYQKSVQDEIRRLNEVAMNRDLPESVPNDDDGTNGSDDHDHMIDFKEQIKHWIVKHNITRRATNDLLSILISVGFDFLPKDSRTLLKTPVSVDIKKLSHGQLWYPGIEQYLENIFQHIQSDIVIHLDFNCDGVDLFESSKTNFWPIIASIRGIYTFMFMVFIYDDAYMHVN